MDLNAGKKAVFRSDIFAITHCVELKNGDKYYGILLNQDDDKLEFAFSSTERRFIKLNEVESFFESSLADSVGIKKGIHVDDKEFTFEYEYLGTPKNNC